MIRFFAIVLRITAPLLILAAGLGLAYYLFVMRVQPKKEETPQQVTLVNVIEAQPSKETIVISSHGEVMPEKSIQLKPQISGEIIEISPNLVPGGFFEKGEVIARIDPRDFEFVLEQRKAEYERAILELKQEQGRKTVAEDEWKRLEDSIPTTDVGKSLALREPHLQFAKANVQAKKAQVEDAKLDLERTVLHAPFNAFVRRENVDVGEIVNPQTSIAELSGTDNFWVRATLPVADLQWIEWPENKQSKGSRAVVRLDSGKYDIQHEGRVIRLLGDLEPDGRLARVLVEIQDPFGLKQSPPDEIPLIEGLPSSANAPESRPQAQTSTVPLLLEAYVNVYIEGKSVDGVFPVPWEAIREGRKVWIMNQENRLEIRDVEILWERENEALVGGGLSAGDRIVMGRLPSVIPGMRLKATSVKDSRLAQNPSKQADTDQSGSLSERDLQEVD